MKRLQLVWTAFALWAAACGAVTAQACEKQGAASAAVVSSGGSAACPSAMAAHCSAAQAAACKASGMSCPTKGASASAVTASAAAAAGCPGMAGTAVHACPGMTGTSTSAMTAGTAGSQCRGEGLVKVAEQFTHPDCDGCTDMARCAQEIAAAGARVQVVPLKNGVMYVYTVESSAGVRAVQAAVEHRNERLAALVTAGDKVKLCSRCKEMRGAAASGKLSREVVNIEGGCLTLMTSSDPVIVQRLHEMASASLVSARTKS